MKDDKAFIEHILEGINAVGEFYNGLSKEELKSNRLKQSAIVREIEIIGEAVKNISIKLKKEYPKIKWLEIARTRDKMIHRYFGLDLEIIWVIINKDLKMLKKQIIEIRNKLF